MGRNRVIIPAVLAAFMAMVAIGLALDFTGGRAATATVSWSVHERQDTSSFVPSPTHVVAPAPGAGYEIVSFSQDVPSVDSSGYVYGGPDLPPALGGPLPSAIVTCTAIFEPDGLRLVVENAYPYAGCVFFAGITNTGDVPVEVELGALDPDDLVTCDAPGCSADDVDLLGGGADAATVGELCRTFDATGAPNPAGVQSTGGLGYSIEPGATFVCPMFLTVAQPAAEAATYMIWVSPPENAVTGP